MRKALKEQELRAAVGTKTTVIGLIVNTLLTILKIFVGNLMGSIALITDGVHSFTDIASDLFVIVSFQLSRGKDVAKKKVKRKVVDILAGAVVSIIQIFLALIITSVCIDLIISLDPQNMSTPNVLILVVALVSILVKELLYRYTLKAAKKADSSVLKENALNNRHDSFTSICVFIGVGLAKLLGGTWLLLEPIVGIVIAAYIVEESLTSLIRGYNNLIDKSASSGSYDMIYSVLENMEGVNNVENIETKFIGNTLSIGAEILVDPEMKIKEAYEKEKEAEKKLKEEFGKDSLVSIRIKPSK